MKYIKSITWPSFNKILKELGIVLIGTSVITAAIAAIILAVYMLVRPDKSKSQAIAKK